MKNLAFLTCEKLKDQEVDDFHLIKELEKHSFKVSTIPWMDNADWKSFDAVIIRTPWDYMEHAEDFKKKLDLISSKTRLINSLNVVEWNFHKKYLKELEAKGIKIVPTLIFRHNQEIKVPTEWRGKLILKPAISANSFKTIVLERHEIENGNFKNFLHPGDWMLQPFLEEIKQGEISLHYFNKEYSHAIIKVPKEGDFRVQEEFGGDIQPLNADERLKVLGERILNEIPHELLYARVDLVPVQGEYLLMELELIEPCLYFRTNSKSPHNFLKALKQTFNLV